MLWCNDWKQSLRKARRNQLGQGITEYGAVLAFVAILIGITINVGKTQLAPAVSQAFDSVTVQLNKLNQPGNSGQGST